MEKCTRAMLVDVKVRGIIVMIAVMILLVGGQRVDIIMIIALMAALASETTPSSWTRSSLRDWWYLQRSCLTVSNGQSCVENGRKMGQSLFGCSWWWISSMRKEERHREAGGVMIGWGRHLHHARKRRERGISWCRRGTVSFGCHHVGLFSVLVLLAAVAETRKIVKERSRLWDGLSAAFRGKERVKCLSDHPNKLVQGNSHMFFRTDQFPKEVRWCIWHRWKQNLVLPAAAAWHCFSHWFMWREGMYVTD